MNVLVTNDDGVNSQGLIKLAKKLSINNKVLLIAPDGNRSACSHSLSVGKDLKVVKINIDDNFEAYKTSGTPVDCVKISKLVFSDFKTDIVVAGINKGHNLGSDILYSGTLSAACEGAFFNLVSFAFSAFELGESDFDGISNYAVSIINKLYPLSNKGDIWNINFPPCSPNRYKGVKIAKFGKQLYSDRYEKIGVDTYRLVGELIDHNENEQDCDVEWIKKGYVSVTPVLYDKTDKNRLDKFKNINLDL